MIKLVPGYHAREGHIRKLPRLFLIHSFSVLLSHQRPYLALCFSTRHCAVKMRAQAIATLAAATLTALVAADGEDVKCSYKNKLMFRRGFVSESEVDHDTTFEALTCTQAYLGS